MKLASRMKNCFISFSHETFMCTSLVKYVDYLLIELLANCRVFGCVFLRKWRSNCCREINYQKIMN